MCLLFPTEPFTSDDESVVPVDVEARGVVRTAIKTVRSRVTSGLILLVWKNVSAQFDWRVTRVFDCK